MYHCLFLTFRMYEHTNTSYCEIFGAYCESFAAYYEIFGAYCEIFAAYCESFAAYCEIFAAYCEIFAAYCELYKPTITQTLTPIISLATLSVQNKSPQVPISDSCLLAVSVPILILSFNIYQVKKMSCSLYFNLLFGKFMCQNTFVNNSWTLKRKLLKSPHQISALYVKNKCTKTSIQWYLLNNIIYNTKLYFTQIT